MTRRFNRAVWDRRAGQRGFTLIELLVVIAVLAVLAVVVLFNVTGVKNKGQAASCATDLKTVQTAVDSYVNDTGITTGGTSSDAGIDALLGSAHTATITNAAVAGTPGLTFTAAFLAMPASGGSTFQPAYIHTNTTGCSASMTLAQANGTNDNNGFTIAGS